MRILEDDDGFPENDSLFIIGFLHDNLLDAFAELVAYSYLPKTTTGQPSRLFTAEVQSRYSGKSTLYTLPIAGTMSLSSMMHSQKATFRNT